MHIRTVEAARCPAVSPFDVQFTACDKRQVATSHI